MFGPRFLSVFGRRLGVLAAVELGPAPRPDAIDLHLERETEADPDQTMTPRTATLSIVGSTIMVRTMSAMIRTSRPSRMQRPRFRRSSS